MKMWVNVSGSLLQSAHEISSIGNCLFRTSIVGSTFQAIFHKNSFKCSCIFYFHNLFQSSFFKGLGEEK